MSGEFGGERIRVWGIDEGIPPHEGMTLGVRQRRHVFVGLDEDLRSVAADDGEERVWIRLPEPGLKAKLVAVEGDGLIDVADDEAGRTCRRGGSCHRRGDSCTGVLRFIALSKMNPRGQTLDDWVYSITFEIRR